MGLFRAAGLEESSFHNDCIVIPPQEAVCKCSGYLGRGVFCIIHTIRFIRKGISKEIEGGHD